MTSWAFNPLTIAGAMVATIFLASVLLPPDTWDRVKDFTWRSHSMEEPLPPTIDRPMPWEQQKKEREHASAIMQAELDSSETAASYGDSFAQRWSEGRKAQAALPIMDRQEGRPTPRKDAPARSEQIG